MADTTSNSFFTKKHKRLLNFASIANILAWIVLIVGVFAAFGKFS